MNKSIELPQLTIKANGKQKYLGSSNDPLACSILYDNYIADNNLEHTQNNKKVWDEIHKKNKVSEKQHLDICLRNARMVSVERNF